jgi:predicted O-methyltransferase YrrM
VTGIRTWRRWALGLATLCGAGRGYFVPHRYAGVSSVPATYAALEPLFRCAEPEFAVRLEEASRYLPALRGFTNTSPPAPRFEQDWFPRLDAAIAYTLVRSRRPRRIVEIGSGHSTRFMARAIADEGLATVLTAIDPAPRATLAGLPVEWLRQPLQTVGLAPFAALAEGDVLFIDSSHVLMPGSDVDILLNEICPRLPAGVLVHIHDIVLPDAYPDAWRWRGYNEQNALAGMLRGGARLLWSSHWVVTRQAGEVARAGLDTLPLAAGAHETSLWLETG